MRNDHDGARQAVAEPLPDTLAGAGETVIWRTRTAKGRFRAFVIRLDSMLGRLEVWDGETPIRRQNLLLLCGPTSPGDDDIAEWAALAAEVIVNYEVLMRR